MSNYVLTTAANVVEKIIDHPNKRKLHKGEIPLVGGISIYLSILVLLPLITTQAELWNSIFITIAFFS